MAFLWRHTSWTPVQLKKNNPTKNIIGWVRYLLADTLPVFSQESDQLQVAGHCIRIRLQSRRTYLNEVTYLGKYSLIGFCVNKNAGLF
jgi:hypothetical protein